MVLIYCIVIESKVLYLVILMVFKSYDLDE